MTENILIVDDEPSVRELLRNILERNGYCCALASDAEEALQYLEKHAFDLILCDIIMPGMSGLVLMRQVASKYPDMAILVVTAIDDLNDSKAALEIGIYGYVIKPFTPNQIFISVFNALRRRKLEISHREHLKDLETTVSDRTKKLEDINAKLLNEISERMNAQNVVQESEQKYRLLINNIPGSVYIGYKDWSVDFIDNKFADLIGYDKNLFDNRTLKWSNIIIGEDLEKAIQAVRQALKKDNTYIREYRIKTKSGEKLFLQDRGQIVRNEKGEIEYFFGIFFDITEQKKAQDQILQQERYYRSILTNMHESIVVIKENYEVTDVNNTFLTYASCSRDEAIGRKCYEVLHGYDQPCHRYGTNCKLGEVFETSEPHQRLFELVGKDGSSHWLDIMVSPLKDEENKVTRVIESVRDITEQKKIEQALWNSEEKYRLLVNNAGDAVLIVQDEKIKFSNPKAHEITGYSFEEQTKVPLTSFIHPEDRDEVLEVYTRRLNGHKPFGMFPFRIMSKSGKELWVQINATSITWDGKPATLIYLRDISQCKQAEEEKKKIEAQLLQSEKMASIGQLAAGVAHEINNPTGFVSSNLRSLSEYIKDISGLSKEYRKLIEDLKQSPDAENGLFAVSGQVKSITELEEEIDLDFVLKDIIELIEESREGTERIKKIVQNLKDFAHPGEEKPKFSDINQNIESTVNVVWNELKYKADVIKDYGDLPQVLCYPQLLNQVFMNLLVNAAQAIEHRGKIKIKTQVYNGNVEIKISDTGSGIPKENLPKVFDPFFTTKEIGKGTGLGLNVAYNIIRKHDGKIDVISDIGKGTTFTIKIPTDHLSI